MAFARLLLFSGLCALVSPLLVVGTVRFALRIFFDGRPRGISGTAYEPLWSRLFLHDLGLRVDAALAQLAPHLPALTPFTVWCLSRLSWAARVSGHRGALFLYPPERPAPLLAMVNQRCEFFDRTLREAVAPESGPGVEQVVMLGSGWDTRAYGDLKVPGVRFFEVDQPPTARAKQAALSAAGIETAHVTFVETDFDQHGWLESLQQHGFDPFLRTHVLWEGVSYYLAEDAVWSTFGAVEKLAPGSRIAFDYLSSEFLFGPLGQALLLNLKGFYGESMHFGIPTRKSPPRDSLVSFLRGTSLSVVDYAPFGKRVALGGLALAIREG